MQEKMQEKIQEKIQVVAAMIEREDGRVLAVLRSAEKKIGNRWEFPGGKVEKGESYFQTAEREVLEELCCKVEAVEEIGLIYEEMENCILEVHFVKCLWRDTKFTLTEHDAFVWIKKENILSLKFAEADRPMLEKIEKEGSR